MIKPDIQQTLGGFIFTWDDHKIRVNVGRIKQHKDNRLTAWLIFVNTASTEGGLIHQCELNFAASSSQNTLANTLEKKNNKPPWDIIIEQVRYYVIDSVRQGEPVETISTGSADILPITYLVHPLLPEGQPTILFGEPGAGKSRIANLLYICLALPWWDNPLGLTVPDNPVVPLILDWETDRNTTLWRIKAMVEGMELPMIDVHYRRCLTRIADDLDQIKLAIEKVGANCLIIDSLAAACGGELMKPETAEEFFTAVRQLNMTTFIIAQTQKDPELRRKSILGSTIFEYYARSIWEIKKSQTAGEDEMHVALMHTKANESKHHKSLNYRFFFNEDHITVSTEKMTDVADFSGNVPLKERIRLELMHGPLTAKELSENLEQSASYLSKTLSLMKSDKNLRNRVVNLGENKWGLAA